MFNFTKNKKNGGNPVKDNKRDMYKILNFENLLINKFKYEIDLVL
jgi:hypothetical protein